MWQVNFLGQVMLKGFQKATRDHNQSQIKGTIAPKSSCWASEFYLRQVCTCGVWCQTCSCDHECGVYWDKFSWKQWCFFLFCGWSSAWFLNCNNVLKGEKLGFPCNTWQQENEEKYLAIGVRCELKSTEAEVTRVVRVVSDNLWPKIVVPTNCYGCMIPGEILIKGNKFKCLSIWEMYAYESSEELAIALQKK